MKKLFKGLGLGLMALALVVGAGAGSASAALTVGALTLASDGAFTLTGAVGSNIALGSTTTTGSLAIGDSMTTGSITAGAALTTGSITLGGAQTSGAISIGGGVQTGTITLGGGTGAQTVNLATGSTGVKTVNLATGTAANVISIGTGQTAGSIAIGTAMTTGTITIGSITSGLLFYEDTETVSGANVIAATETGTTYYISTTGAAYTLPAVAVSNGVVLRFVVAAAFSTDAVITSAAGDDIEGSLIVAGAVVDCDAADTITFEDGVENLGDFVEVRSNGTKWFVTQSNSLTAVSLTCAG